MTPDYTYKAGHVMSTEDAEYVQRLEQLWDTVSAVAERMYRFEGDVLDGRINQAMKACNQAYIRTSMGAK